MSKMRMIVLYGFLLGSCLGTSTTQALAQTKEISPKEFLERYRAGIEPVTQAYKQVQIEAVFTVNSLTDKIQRVNRRTLMEDGKYFKVIDDYESGTEKGTQDIHVANPERSFMLGSDQEGKFIKIISRRNTDYDRWVRDCIQHSFLVRFVDSIGETSILDYLTMKEATIEQVMEENVKGRTLVRVRFRVLPFHEQMREAKMKHAVGWLLLDPKMHWALQAFERKNIREDDSLIFGQRGTMEYGDPVNGIPVLRRVYFESFKTEGAYDAYEGVIKSVRFVPTDPAEFTLKGCGFMDEVDDASPYLSGIFYWCLVAGTVALVGIALLRRRLARHVAVGKASSSPDAASGGPAVTSIPEPQS